MSTCEAGGGVGGGKMVGGTEIRTDEVRFIFVGKTDGTVEGSWKAVHGTVCSRVKCRRYGS